MDGSKIVSLISLTLATSSRSVFVRSKFQMETEPPSRAGPIDICAIQWRDVKM